MESEILTKVFCDPGPNLVILAWTDRGYRADKLDDKWMDGWTDTQTDAGNDNTPRPKLASEKNEKANRDWVPAKICKQNAMIMTVMTDYF